MNLPGRNFVSNQICKCPTFCLAILCMSIYKIRAWLELVARKETVYFFGEETKAIWCRRHTRQHSKHNIFNILKRVRLPWKWTHKREQLSLSLVSWSLVKTALQAILLQPFEFNNRILNMGDVTSMLIFSFCPSYFVRTLQSVLLSSPHSGSEPLFQFEY